MTLVLVVSAIALAAASAWFVPEIEVLDRPVFEIAAGMVAAGLAFLAVVPLTLATLRYGLGDDFRFVLLIAAGGLVMRLALMGSTPILEDDFYRYLWDGGVTVSGNSPYTVSPNDAQSELYHYSLQPLARQSGVVIERLNHSELKTIYPPVAQAAFALAHVVSPWSLTAWRLVCLAAELATMALLLTLLREAARPAIWVALYWLNPLIAKELINSAHMDAIVSPLVLVALLMTIRRRPSAAAVAIGLAIGAKIWPLILVPLIFRPWFREPRQLLMPVLILIVLCIAFAIPVISGGLDTSSGLTAYATRWRNSSGLYVILQKSLMWLSAPFDPSKETIGAMIRIVLAVTAGAVTMWAVWRPIANSSDMLARAAIITAALVLLSPSQFPWYAAWTLPLAVFRPFAGILLMTALMPVYYTGFYYSEREIYQVYRESIVFLIWLPVWGTFAYEVWRHRQGLPPLVGELEPHHA